MAFCAKCGAQSMGQFCPACGAPTPDGAAGIGSAPMGSAPASGMTTNLASTLCYVLGFITGIVFLVLAPYNTNKEVRFHAFQSIFLSLGFFVLNIALNIVLPVIALLAITPLLSLAIFGLWLFMLWKTYSGEKIVLPVIGPLAQQQAG